MDAAMESDYNAEAMYMRQKQFIDDTVDEYCSVLEIGAATGANLNLYKEAGKTVVGIEPSGNNKRWAEKNYGIKLYDMTLDEYYGEYGCQEQYDIVFISHVLEHIVNFVEFMQKAVALSRKYIFVELPILEEIINEEAPFAAFTNEHVNYFSISSLKILMERCGCMLIKYVIAENKGGTLPGYPTMVSLWKGEGYSSTINCAVDYSASEIIQRYIKVNNEKVKRIQNIIDTISVEEKVAVWGTGEHTSKLLAMTDLASKNIIKFYDSDVKKKGMSMLGKQVQPFDVKDIEDGVVDTILISTYSSERSIKKYVDNLKIAKEFRIILLYS